MEVRRVVVIGGGITGLTCAFRLLTTRTESGRPPLEVTVIEAEENLGGKIRTSRFADLMIDEGPDAYLARVPHAVGLSRDLGLGPDITHPAIGHAAVWHRRLHPIPAGLLLGVPSGSMSLARSGLVSMRGKLRAALEPVLPSSGDPGDSIGVFVRRRFGREVHELLVDPLVGSIYAADTMNFSLDMVPQLADLARHRSTLLAARKRLSGSPTPTDPVFETPRQGLGSLIDALRSRIEASGGHILSGTRADWIERETRSAPSGVPSYRISTTGRHESEIDAHAVVVCSPARASESLFRRLDDTVADACSKWTHASVVIATVRARTSNAELLRGLSGYLVPKADQDRVTAVSFGSNKWAHWRPADGSLVLRISLGRDGVPTHDLVHEWDDDRLVRQAIDEVGRHTGATLDPVETRISRWPESFPQYRPGHVARVAELEKRLAGSAPGVFLAGASWHGIGIPACVGDANHIAGVTGQYLAAM